LRGSGALEFLAKPTSAIPDLLEAQLGEAWVNLGARPMAGIGHFAVDPEVLRLGIAGKALPLAGFTSAH